MARKRKDTEELLEETQTDLELDTDLDVDMDDDSEEETVLFEKDEEEEKVEKPKPARKPRAKRTPRKKAEPLTDTLLASMSKAAEANEPTTTVLKLDDTSSTLETKRDPAPSSLESLTAAAVAAAPVATPMIDTAPPTLERSMETMAKTLERVNTILHTMPTIPTPVEPKVNLRFTLGHRLAMAGSALALVLSLISLGLAQSARQSALAKESARAERIEKITADAAARSEFDAAVAKKYAVPAPRIGTPIVPAKKAELAMRPKARDRRRSRR